MSYEALGYNDQDFYTVDEAIKHYELESRDSILASQCDQELYEKGITTVEIPVPDSDFEALTQGFDLCIDECPELLEATFYKVDKRFGNEAGYKRKEAKFTDGLQTDDPKSFIHFNELSRLRWTEQFKNPPRIFKEILEAGYEIHDALISVARNTFTEIEETHPGISRSHFPGNRSCSFMRILSYDDYPADRTTSAEVAKPHYDIGGATIQAYADAPGFWGTDNPQSPRNYYDTSDGQGYFFTGQGYRKLYGENGRMQPLYHGVERVLPAGLVHIPRRHSIVLFIDAPNIDYGVSPQDTLPELYAQQPSDEQKIA